MIPLIFSILGPVACSGNANDAIVIKGFDSVFGQNSEAPRVQVGIKCLREQSTRLNIDVYFGAVKGYDEDWGKNNIAIDEEFLITESIFFALKRIILDNDKNVIDDDYYVIEDFPNFNKYPLHHKYIEGTTDGYTVSFDYCLNDEIDILDYSGMSEGIIFYRMVIYDIDKKEEINLNLDSLGEDVSFEVVDTNVVHLF